MDDGSTLLVVVMCSGQIAITKLNRMLETSRFNLASGHGLTLPPSYLFFVLGTHLTVSPNLHHHASLYLPLVYESRPLKVGTSSFDVLQRLFLDPNPEKPEHEYVNSPKPDSILASYVFRFVSLDRDTKRSKSIPDDERDRMNKLIGSGGSIAVFPKMDLLEKPPEGASSFTHEIQPRYSDMDPMFHINQGVYLDYATECAARASAAGAFRKFGSEDICFRKLESAFNIYSAESFPTDTLSVTVWEDAANPETTLHFVIRGIAGQLVFRSKFVYNVPEKE